jgi:hypothetical protein
MGGNVIFVGFIVFIAILFHVRFGFPFRSGPQKKPALGGPFALVYFNQRFTRAGTRLQRQDATTNFGSR